MAPLVLLPGIDGQVMVWDRVVKTVTDREVWATGLPRGDLPVAAELLLKQVSVNEFFIGGVSYGGLVARAAAELAPHRIRGVCMIGTLPRGTFCPPQIRWSFALLRRMPPAVFSRLYRMHLRRRLHAEGFSPGECQEFSQLNLSKSDYLQRLREVMAWNLSEKVDVPALLLKGVVDTEAPWTIESAKEALPGVDVRAIPGGHRAPWTHTDIVAQTMSQWMADVEGNG